MKLLDKIADIVRNWFMGVAGMRVGYREDKATQAAGHLLRLAGGKMDIYLLVKLLYLADREALVGWGRPITFDKYACMPYGPAVGNTYDKAKPDTPPQKPTYWNIYIDTRRGDTITLKQEPPNDQLSPAEEGLLTAIYDRFGKWSFNKLKLYCENLPEWENPGKSSKPLSRRDILRAAHVAEADIDEAEDALKAEDFARKVLG